MAHDFKRFPELTNNQMDFYYWDSPHKQILESFHGEVVKVTDGDTIHVKWSEREKPIRVRFLNTAAPELDEEGGREAQSWLEKEILGEYVEVSITPGLRVGKWGRILGEIIHLGRSINNLSLDLGYAIPFSERTNGT